MVKKVTVIVLTGCFILCTLAGCGESTPTDELVEGGYKNALQSDGADVAAMVSERKPPALSKLRESVKEELGDNYWPEITLSKEELEEKTGIIQDMYVEFLAEESSLKSNIDMMIIVRAKEDYVGAIEEALEEYRTRLIEENKQYPQNYNKASASRIETIENYICFVQLGADTTIVADKGGKEILAYCQEENERALHVLEKAILR
ncbi:MAG: DUF4358 domain-containing protein [Bacillus sp. (in: Bacteria)]|nr:DUF4358 domain-containing protein [Bacillus sp. (in: firmicutes)]MCM1426606.1 DUF4358 domain-containing protein [Eubacterium sp.]